MIDHITTVTKAEIFNEAYKQASKSSRKVTPQNLVWHAGIVALNLRDEWIWAQGEKIEKRFQSKIVDLWPVVFDRMYETDQDYLRTFDDSDIDDPDYGPQIVAHAVAVLRWYKLLHTGRVNSLLAFGIGEAADWLARGQDLPASKDGQLGFLELFN